MMNFIVNLLSGSTDGAPKAGNGWTTWLLLGGLVVVIVVMFFISSRRNKQAQKEEEERNNSLRVGLKIQTIGGIIGEIVDFVDEDNAVIIETGTMRMEINRRACYPFVSEIPTETNGGEESASDGASDGNAQ